MGAFFVPGRPISIMPKKRHYIYPSIPFKLPHGGRLSLGWVSYLLCGLLICSVFFGCKPNPKPGKAGQGRSAVSPIILLQPFTDIDATTMRFLQRHLADSFGLEVRLLPPQPLPANSWYAARKRYWADTILQHLKQLAPPNGFVLGVTGSDISTRHARYANWGVMGLGFLPGPAAVVSNYRLQRFGLTDAQLRYRLLKVALHELGHNFGLPHCPVQSCLMVDADGKDKLDQEHGFCVGCRALLPRRTAKN